MVNAEIVRNFLRNQNNYTNAEIENYVRGEIGNQNESRVQMLAQRIRNRVRPNF